MTAVISKIISMQQSLTVSENEIGQYVMNHADEVVTSTITVVASNTGTSEASINRFCKKLGFKGFNSFKIALAQESFFYKMKERGEPYGDSSFIAAVSRDYNQMLSNTSAMLEEDVVLDAARCIKSAANIYIFAYAGTAFTASELEFKLQMAGLRAQAITDTNTMRMFATGIQRKDLAILIVPTILMRDIYQVATICKDRGAHVLTITSFDSPKLNDLSDYKFVTSDKITARNSIALSNNLLFLYVADVLYSALLNSDKALRQKKLNSDAMLGASQMADNYMLEY